MAQIFEYSSVLEHVTSLETQTPAPEGSVRPPPRAKAFTITIIIIIIISSPAQRPPRQLPPRPAPECAICLARAILEAISNPPGPPHSLRAPHFGHRALSKLGPARVGFQTVPGRLGIPRIRQTSGDILGTAVDSEGPPGAPRGFYI